MAVSFRSLAGISSDPVALLISREFSKVSTSSPVKVNSVKPGSTVVLLMFVRKVFRCEYGGEVDIKKFSYFSRVCCNWSGREV